MLVECPKIALCDYLAKRIEVRCELCGFRSGEESLRREAAQADIRGDEISKNLSSVGEVLTMTKIIGRLKGELGAVEMAVREVVGTKIVEVLRDTHVSD